MNKDTTNHPRACNMKCTSVAKYNVSNLEILSISVDLLVVNATIICKQISNKFDSLAIATYSSFFISRIFMKLMKID